MNRLTEMTGIEFLDLPYLDAYLHFSYPVLVELNNQGKATDQRIYADLNLRELRIAHRLLSCKTDVKTGDRVLLLCSPGLEFVEARFGCIRARVAGAGGSTHFAGSRSGVIRVPSPA